MKKITILLSLLFGVLLFNSSKPYMSDNNNSSKTRLDSLMSKKWRWERGGSSAIQIYYKDSIVSNEKRSTGELITLGHLYYLTNDISKLVGNSLECVAYFDWSKVGKSVNGRYLVTYNNKLNNDEYKGWCYMYEILELTDTKLELQYVHHTGEREALPSLVYMALD